MLLVDHLSATLLEVAHAHALVLSILILISLGRRLLINNRLLDQVSDLLIGLLNLLLDQVLNQEWVRLHLRGAIRRWLDLGRRWSLELLYLTFRLLLNDLLTLLVALSH